MYKERECKQAIKCPRQRLAWCNRTQQRYDPNKEQYSLYPRALCDESGIQHKGVKIWTDKIRKRYSSASPQVMMDSLTS